MNKSTGKSVCDYNICTGCGACRYVCPADCIEMTEHADGNIYPEVNRESCINCGRCERVCPSLSPVVRQSGIKAYAAWNTDENAYEHSASGGTASAICEYAAENGDLFVGASIDEKGFVSLNIFDSVGAIKKVRNSKYVFSSMYDLFPELEKRLKEGKSVYFFGLPCQAAAVRNLFDKKYGDRIFYCDLVCHGITPYSYLEQHVREIEKAAGKTARKITFRDPGKADKYPVFSLSCFDDKGNRFYSKRTADGDAYQYAYHRAVAYRENCYRCPYAAPERCGDLTLSDFRAFDKLKDHKDLPKKVSSVIANTEKGVELTEKLVKSGKLKAIERPADEPVRYDKQLSSPSAKTGDRLAFEQNIREYHGDFNKAIGKLCEANLKKEKANSRKNSIKQKIKKLLRK